MTTPTKHHSRRYLITQQIIRWTLAYVVTIAFFHALFNLYPN